MLIDTFLFNGEWDMLALRLRTLDEIVGRFVLVESGETFSGMPKPWAFDNPPDEFKPWLSRIRYVRVSDSVGSTASAWRGHERPVLAAAMLDHQRDCVMRGLDDAADDDVVLLADLDEIPDPRVYGHVLELLKEHPLVNMGLRMYGFWLNAFVRNWGSCVWAQARTLRKSAKGLGEIFSRHRASGALPCVRGGWHFTWMGPLPRIEAKLGAMMERKWDTPAFRVRLREAYPKAEYCMCPVNRKLIIGPIDDTFPLPLQQDSKRWAHMIKQV